MDFTFMETWMKLVLFFYIKPVSVLVVIAVQWLNDFWYKIHCIGTVVCAQKEKRQWCQRGRRWSSLPRFKVYQRVHLASHDWMSWYVNALHAMLLLRVLCWRSFVIMTALISSTCSADCAVTAAFFDFVRWTYNNNVHCIVFGCWK